MFTCIDTRHRRAAPRQHGGTMQTPAWPCAASTMYTIAHKRLTIHAFFTPIHLAPPAELPQGSACPGRRSLGIRYRQSPALRRVPSCLTAPLAMESAAVTPPLTPVSTCRFWYATPHCLRPGPLTGPSAPRTPAGKRAAAWAAAPRTAPPACAARQPRTPRAPPAAPSRRPAPRRTAPPRPAA